MGPRTLWPLLAGVVAALIGCHTITEQATPTGPTPPVTLAPLVIPVILPSPNPTPRPTPTPAPGPTPTPSPNPTPPPPAGSSCSLPPSNPSNPRCGKESPSFLNQLEDAITQVTTERPDLFDLKDKRCENCYRVKDVNSYIAAVMKRLGAKGLCTYFDGEEVQIKSTNNFNDGYDIITSDNYIRRGSGSYRGSCHPSWF
jgi:hypothetical protein